MSEVSCITPLLSSQLLTWSHGRSQSGSKKAFQTLVGSVLESVSYPTQTFFVFFVGPPVAARIRHGGEAGDAQWGRRRRRRRRRRWFKAIVKAAE